MPVKSKFNGIVCLRNFLLSAPPSSLPLFLCSILSHALSHPRAVQSFARFWVNINVNRLFLKWVTDSVYVGLWVWPNTEHIGTSALYDLIHCQVRWHLAKVALAISIWSNKSIRWPCCAGLCYTLRGPRSIFISFGRWRNRLLPPQAEIYFATLTLPPSAIRKRSFRWVSKCESIVFCYYLRYEYE